MSKNYELQNQQGTEAEKKLSTVMKDIEKKDAKLKALRIIVVIALCIAGFSCYQWHVQKKENARLALDFQEQQNIAKIEYQQRADSEAKNREEARERAEKNIANIESKLIQAEIYINDALNIIENAERKIDSAVKSGNLSGVRDSSWSVSNASTNAETAKAMISNVMNSLCSLDAGDEFTHRISLLMSKIQECLINAGKIIAKAEYLRAKADSEASKLEENAALEKVKNSANNILAELENIPGLHNLPLVYADNVMHISAGIIDTPMGKINVCRNDDSYAFVDYGALTKILKSFCGEEYASNIPEKYFMFRFIAAQEDFDKRLRNSESEIFTSLQNVRPANANKHINLEEYLIRTLTTTNQRNFRLFYKCEGNNYVIVLINIAGKPEVFIGSESQPVSKSKFLRELAKSSEINSRAGWIAFYLKNNDESLKSSGIDKKFELFISQIINSGGALND